MRDNRTLVTEDKRKEMAVRLMAEAERARFEAKNKGKPARLYFSYGFSDIDPMTNIAFTWDLWVRFPFKVPKEQCEKFKEAIQNEFEKAFLS
jgi:hypothetical protein